MPTPELNDDFQDMLHCLIDEAAEFIIVGAHALAAHGLPRATGDIEIFVRPTEDNANRVLRALVASVLRSRPNGVSELDFSVPGTVYQIGLPPPRIDLLTAISAVPFEEAWTSRIIAQVGDLTLPVLGREALLKNKLATGRDKDALDVRALAQLKG